MTETTPPPTPNPTATIARPSFFASVGHWLRWLLWSILILVLGTTIGAITWVRSAPRNLDRYLPAFVEYVNQHQNHASIQMSHLNLYWEKWNKPLMISVKQLDIKSKALAPVAEFPDAMVGIDMAHLMIGQLRLRRLEAQNAKVYIEPLASMLTARLSANEERTAAPVLHTDMFGRLRWVDVNHITFVFPQKEGEFEAKGAFHLAKTHTAIEADGRIFLSQAHGQPRQTLLNFTAKAPRNSRQYDVEGNIENLLLSDFSYLPFMKDLAGLTAPVHSRFTGTTSPNKTQLKGTLSLENGVLDANKLFPSPLPITSLQSLWEWDSQKSSLQLHNLALALPEVTLHADISAKLSKENPALDVNARMGRLSIERLRHYWPLVLAPLTRDWAMASILSGDVENAVLRMHLTPQDFEAPYFSKEAVDADITLKQARLKYIPEHPEVREIDGVLHFTGTTMDVNITNAATLSGARVSKGHLHISDLNSADTRLQAKLHLNAPAIDVVTFLALPDINLAKRLNLSPATAKGMAQGEVDFDALIFTSEPNPTPEFFAEQFFYNIKGHLENVSAPQLLGNKDIEQGNLTVAFSNDALSVEGTARINGAETQLLLTQDEKTKTDMTEATLKGDAEGLSKFGITLVPYVQGPVEMVVKSKQVGDDPEKTHLTLKLDAATIDYPYLALKKSAGEMASLSFEHIKKNGLDELNALELKTNAGTSAGKVVYDSANKSVISADFSRLKTGKHDCALTYSQEDGIQTLNVKGASLDATGFWNDKPDPKTPREDFGAMLLDMDVKTLYLHKDFPLLQVKASLLCSHSHCARAQASGFTSKGNDFHVSITKKNSQRLFKADAKNAGEFIRALDFMDNIEGGSLEIEGQYQDSQQPNGLKGTLYIRDVYLNKAPLITKILSLTSPLGFVETLMGKGVSFTRTRIPFHYADKTITLKEAKASGPSLGLLASGTIDTHTSKVDIDGSVVPAYALNNVIEKIPLLGQVLTGGKGEGLIATRFHANGTYPDPDVTVNPLSILTPGFLRNIFDVFDGPDTAQVNGGATSESSSNPSSATNARSGPDAQTLAQ